MDYMGFYAVVIVIAMVPLTLILSSVDYNLNFDIVSAIAAIATSYRFASKEHRPPAKPERRRLILGSILVTYSIGIVIFCFYFSVGILTEDTEVIDLWKSGAGVPYFIWAIGFVFITSLYWLFFYLVYGKLTKIILKQTQKYRHTKAGE